MPFKNSKPWWTTEQRAEYAVIRKRASRSFSQHNRYEFVARIQAETPWLSPIFYTRRQRKAANKASRDGVRMRGQRTIDMRRFRNMTALVQTEPQYIYVPGFTAPKEKPSE